jgi:hypothetical protein
MNTKSAKAVVKKPRSAKAVVKATKAVVKKPKKYNGGGSGMSIFGHLKSYLPRITKKKSNAVAPTAVINEEQQAPEPQKAPIEKCVRPSSSKLLNKILDDYNALFVDKITSDSEIFTVYDLLVLIENIADNLNKFFEDFLHFYPIIIFKVVNKNDHEFYYDDDNKFLKFQEEFVEINSIIRSYIENLGRSTNNIPRFWGTQNIYYVPLPEHYSKIRYDGHPVVTYLDTSKIVYNGILDGTQKGIKEYKKSGLKFFKFEYILKLKDYVKMRTSSSPLTLYKLHGITFGDSLFGSKNKIHEFNIVIVEGLYKILRDFFSYIKFMEIKEGNDKIDPEIKKECEKYINDAKITAKKKLADLDNLYDKLQGGIHDNIDRHRITGYLMKLVIND